MSGYIGPIPVPQGIQNKETFTATAGQTTFNTNGYTDGAFISVYLNGVRLINGTDYTATNGSDVVLASAAAASDVVDFESFNSFSLASQQFENITTKNPTHEDTDGGRESALSFQGEQSGGEISTLAAIQASHDGTADDQKGDLIFKTNDGSDNNAPTERLRIDSAGSILTATLGTDNVHLGEGAGDSIASGGNQNTLIGKDAGTALTTGDDNVAVGHSALKTEDGNGRNTAVGFEALLTLNAGVDGENVAVGYRAGKAITTGIMNTLVGTQAGDALTDADYNTVVGRNAMSNDTKGSRAVAIGYGALTNQNFTSATNNYNVAVGFNAGEQITTGVENTLIGSLAGDALTTGDFNVALGWGALGVETKGNKSVAIGTGALDAQTNAGDTDALNTAVGHGAGGAVTSGIRDVYIGALSGDASTHASDNTAVGAEALTANVGGQNIVAVGTRAMKVYNVASGNIYNTVVGSYAGQALSTGTTNTFLGGLCGQNTTTGSNNVLLGYSVETSAVDTSQVIAIGSSVTSQAANNFTFGFGATDSNIAFGATSITAPSDERYKEEIAASTAGLSFINDLRPVTFKWKKAKDLPSDHDSYIADGEDGCDDRAMLSNGETNHGFIAQEVKAAIDAHSEIKDGFKMWSEDYREDADGNKIADTRQRIAPSELVPMLVKAIQELSAKVDALESENTAIKARLDALEAE